MSGFTLVTDSKNSKLGKCSVTLLAQSTCPSTCPFLPNAQGNNGCYANAGNSRFSTARLNKSTDSPEVVALKEVRALRALSQSTFAEEQLPLRLHVVGDFTNVEHLMDVAKALKHYTKPVWGYTHAWKNWYCLSHWAKGTINILASCHTWEEAKRALSRGYAPAITVDAHPADGKAYNVEDMQVIPCPNQTRGVTCDACKLCWNTERLHDRRAVIAFALHGAHKQARAALGSDLVQIGGSIA